MAVISGPSVAYIDSPVLYDGSSWYEYLWTDNPIIHLLTRDLQCEYVSHQAMRVICPCGHPEPPHTRQLLGDTLPLDHAMH